MQILFTDFGFSDDISICLYVPKWNKPVILMCMHQHETITGPREEHKMIQFSKFYNEMKYGADIVDKFLG